MVIILSNLSGRRCIRDVDSLLLQPSGAGGEGEDTKDTNSSYTQPSNNIKDIRTVLVLTEHHSYTVRISHLDHIITNLEV